MPKILILGKGFFGERVQETLGGVIAGRRIRKFSDMQSLLQTYKPRIVINCIGHTGANVDGCEKDKDKTLLANSFVPIMAAEACIRKKIKFVHLSSGCIYHYDYRRNIPLPETKTPDFLGLFYSRSKIYSERALEALSAQYNVLIARPRVPLDCRPHPKNLLTKLIRYRTIIDLPNSVTYVPDFVRALKHLIQKDARGIFNIVNKGALRYPELMGLYNKYVPDSRYQVIPFGTLRLTRTNLLLSTRKLERTGFVVRHINDILEECVRGYVTGV
ncbi:MAG: NAD-dependent epimerase/dehydratase family protein [Candidatus Omnitrophica bacterium]|nr:NAD-dependent epimerase/dehydratase family protein [Candidatus Omnitrophota bacterium]